MSPVVHSGPSAALPPKAPRVRTFVRLFKPRFARLVEDRQKFQTVRPWPKRVPCVGDRIDLREWSGKPYRSPQRKLYVGVITGISALEIDEMGMLFNDGDRVWAADEFAKADGFKFYNELVDWFRAEHGLPFKGVLIEWSEWKQTVQTACPP